MAEMVASALVQEGVSGVLSLAASHHEEKASQGHLVERLEMAQSELEFALERSSKMPITEVSLLRRRMMLKCAFSECTVLLHKHKMPEDEEVQEQTTRVPVSSYSFCRKIMRVVQPSSWSFSGPKKYLLTRSVVGRYEWFAEKAGKFVRDVESGCSLARYRFSNPILTQLLEGKHLRYISGQGKKIFSLHIGAICTEEHGVMAKLKFEYRDPEAPTSNFWLGLDLRLSESTNIVGIGTQCLQSLGPHLKGLTQVAMGELAHLSTPVHVSEHDWDFFPDHEFIGVCRPDPLCCTTSGLNKSCISSAISSELSGRFPEQVTLLRFSCNISGADCNLPSSTKHVSGKTTKVWPYLELRAIFLPHVTWGHWGGGQVSNLHHMEETIHTEAIIFFCCQPKQKEYQVHWFSAHGAAIFYVSKPIVDMRRAPRTIVNDDPEGIQEEALEIQSL